MTSSFNHDDLISEFCAFTRASPADARQYLTANRWDLSGAAAEYFTAREEGMRGAQEEDAYELPPRTVMPGTAFSPPYNGPRTLDGRPAPAAIPTVASSSSSAPPPKRGGIATLGSLSQGSASSGHGHAHDDGEDDSDDEDFEPDEPVDLFAGGEKSGLAVQDPGNRNDPRKVVNDILKKARANAARSGGGESSSTSPPTRFRGSGQTLGGDDTPSQVIPDPHYRETDSGPAQTRTLHLWGDGFSIEDGPLRRFDDPQNAADLQMIRQGRAPLHLMAVRPDQPVDVQLIKHEDNYKAPPKVYKPFSGGGQRLGSPTPGPGPAASAPVAPPPAAEFSSRSVPESTIDNSQPVVTVRIQMADGTRLPARFNTSNTIGDIYTFIERALPSGNARPWVLATTFPNKDHTNKTLALSDVAEFKRGGTAVQKWT